MPSVQAWKVEPLGDRAVLATCKDEATAQQLGAAIREQPWLGIHDVVVAYHSLAVHIDPGITKVTALMEDLGKLKIKQFEIESKLHVIPCCYELGEDLPDVAKQLNLTTEEVITLHTETIFNVYAIGFSPGFPYLGWLPKKLQGIARRAEPRLKVPAGSVAIVGKQSAIYPQETPGGWALIGRTSQKMVDVEAGYFPLKVGDRVRFERVNMT